MTETLWSLVQSCWQVIPTKRPTIKVIISSLRESNTRGVGSLPSASYHTNPSSTAPNVAQPSNSVSMKGTTWRHPLSTYLTIRRLGHVDPCRNRELTSSPLSMADTSPPQLNVGISSGCPATAPQVPHNDLRILEKDVIIALAWYLCSILETNNTFPQVNGPKWVRKELSGYS